MQPNNVPPIAENEMDRVIKLSDLDIDYSDIHEALKDLTKLAAKVAGTEISLINLIDSFTQWSVSNYGLDLLPMPRENSVCQYTIVAKEHFEVKDLSADDRFRNKFYVEGPPALRYYFGVPLQTDDGFNLGALCVLDKTGKEITPEKIELLKIIAKEIVNRLMTMKVIEGLHDRVKEANEARKKAAHDIRGPLGGIIGLAQIISEQGDANRMEEVLEFINLIQQSGNSLLELTDAILATEKKVQAKANAPSGNEFNLATLKEQLGKLYAPQAINKHIDFKVNIVSATQTSTFPKNKLLQIAGNLISNAMKFTPANGRIVVDLDLVGDKSQNTLKIIVSDSGVGIDESCINEILKGAATSTGSTGGEQGYGFGLALVKYLVDTLKGTMHIRSKSGEGTVFTVALPQKRTS
jgi:signal transduction histidine kinase